MKIVVVFLGICLLISDHCKADQEIETASTKPGKFNWAKLIIIYIQVQIICRKIFVETGNIIEFIEHVKMYKYYRSCWYTCIYNHDSDGNNLFNVRGAQSKNELKVSLEPSFYLTPLFNCWGCVSYKNIEN